MYKATRKLMEARKPYSPFNIKHITNVLRVGGGIAHECLDNAYKAQKLGAGIKVVSGWLVDRYNAEGEYTEITQHWWNVDANGRYFDTTPNVDDEFEYVVDMGIALYGQLHSKKLYTPICSSIVMYSNDTYVAVHLVNDTVLTKPMPDVSNDSLFAYQYLRIAA